MEFNNLLKLIGEFGTYQKLLCALLCLVSVPSAFQAMGFVFWGATPKFQCMITGEDGNLTVNENSQCEINARNKTETINGSYPILKLSEAAYGNVSFLSDIRNPTKCDRWQYDQSVYESTIVTEFDLVCEKRWMTSTSQSLYMIGRVFGCISSGYMSDKYGRWVTISVFAVLEFVLSVALSFTPNYISFVTIRTLEALAGSGIWQTAFVLALEIVGPSWRVLVGNSINIVWAFSYMSLAAIAYSVRGRFSLQLATSVPCVFLLLFPWLVPESPRWLIVSGKPNKARTILRKIAKINKTEFPEDCEVKVQNEPMSNGNILHSLRFPNLRKKTLILTYAWFANSFVYYGLSLNTSNLGGNDYLNFFIAGAVEVPAYLFVWLSLNGVGRRLPQAGCLIVGGVALLLCSIVPEEQYVITVVLAMIGKFAISASFSAIYVYSVELFPTCIRASCIGACSMVARVAGALASYTIDLTEISRVLPLIVCGVVATSSGVLVTLLPETKNKTLPETIADGESFGKDRTIMNCIRCVKTRKKEMTTFDDLRQNELFDINHPHPS